MIQKIVQHRASWDLDSIGKLKEQGVGFVTEEMDSFPERLRTIQDSPDALFYKGNLPSGENTAAAIVGARSCSAYGRTIAGELGGQLSLCGIDIISGMAYGIDGYAQKGAVEMGGKTFAILGCGPDICYPRTHIPLYMDIQKRGGILSEFPPGTPPKSSHFPRRNRIISALSDFVIIVEAKERSGSLITADFALEQGRDIYAVPGRVDDPLSRGCNRLIAQGAGLIVSVEDLKKELALAGYLPRNQSVKNDEKPQFALATDEKMVYSCLDLHPKGLEEIVYLTHLPVSSVLSALLSLQIKEYVREEGKTHYCLTG